MTCTEQYIEIENGRLHLHRFCPPGAGGRAPILFLHDALGSIAQWRQFPAGLAGRCRREALVYERFGHGQSSPMEGPRGADYLHREALIHLPALLKALNIREPLIFGHSDGGTIALIYAAHHQPMAIAVEAAHVLVEEITLEGIRTAMAQEDRLKERLRIYHGEKTEVLLNAWSRTWLDPEFRDWDISQEISGIRCPTFIIQGSEDEYGSEEQVRRISHSVQGKVRTLMLEHCGHVPHREEEQTVSDQTAAFFRAFDC